MQDTATAANTAHARRARSCGECDVCCTAMRVADLNKPSGMRCIHMTDTGCGDYQNRPAACRDWYCMWLRDNKGIFSEAERPDRVGIFLTASKPTGSGGQLVFAHPVRPDAMSNPAARAMIERLEQYVPVHVLPYHETLTTLTHDRQPVARTA